MHEVRQTFCERSNVLLKRALMKSIFDHGFLFFALHYVLGDYCELKGTLEEIHVKVVLVDTS